MIEDVFIVGEDAVGEPIIAHVLPDVLDGIELGRLGRQRDGRDVFGHAELRGDMPPGLIHEQNSVSAGLDGKRDLLEMQLHGLGVAKWQDETGRLAECGTDSAEDIGRGGSLIFQGERSRSAFGPATGDLVLLADARLVGEPDLYGAAIDAGFAPDLLQARWETFLESSIAPAACA